MLVWFSEAIRIVGERLRQHLQRHVPIELGVSGAIHLSHAAFTNLGSYLIWSEPGTEFKTHDFGITVSPDLVGEAIARQPPRQGRDGIRAEGGAGFKGHGYGMGTRSVSSWNQPSTTTSSVVDT